jgi:general L-amino acid transport system substrate-binding protein
LTRPVVSIVGLFVLVFALAACGDVSVATPTAGAEESEPAESEPAESQPAESEAEATPAPVTGERLAAVQENGTLVCGVNGSLPGFSFLEEDGTNTGFDADFCRAVAAAVLGDPEAVEFRALTADARGPALQTGEVDVLIRNTTWSVTRDTTWGLFAPTTFYDGQAIMVNADLGASTIEDLAGATICVQSGTTTELNLTDRMRELGIEYTPNVFADIDPTYAAYEEGACDAVTSDRSQLVSRRTAFADPDAHVILDDVLSKEPLGPVVPLGDDQWFNVVKWTVFATIEAEELGITSENVQEMADTSENPVVRRLLGVEGDLAPLLGLENDWVINVISAVGNYGEIYDRNLGPDTAFALERGLNALWTEGGLLYAPPYR